MKCYRIRHKPTGLFFCPSREVRVRTEDGKRWYYTKSNLSKHGKIYPKMPTMRFLGKSVYDQRAWDENKPYQCGWMMVNLEDWEIVEVS